jgi:hypothetical protein
MVAAGGKRQKEWLESRAKRGLKEALRTSLHKDLRTIKKYARKSRPRKCVPKVRRKVAANKSDRPRPYAIRFDVRERPKRPFRRLITCIVRRSGKAGWILYSSPVYVKSECSPVHTPGHCGQCESGQVSQVWPLADQVTGGKDGRQGAPCSVERADSPLAGKAP